MGEPRWFVNHNLGKNEDEMKRSKKYLAAAEKVKMADLNANDIDAASKIIAGTARSMGITVS